MNVAYIIDEFPPFLRGGLGTYAMEITKKLVQMDITPTIYTRNTGSDPVSDIWNGIPVHRPGLLDLTDLRSILSPLDVQSWPPRDQNFFLETILFNQEAAYNLVTHLVREKGKRYDLVVSHDWLGAIAGLIIRRSLNIPFIFHLHSTEQGRVRERSPVVSRIEEKAAGIADAIITVSFAMRDELVREGIPPEKIHVVYNGVDPEKCNPLHFSPDQVDLFREQTGVGKNRMILFIGRLNWVKGADMLLKSLPGVLRDHPDTRLVILGVGEMEQELRDLILTLGLSDHVIMHNRYLPEQVRLLYYASCDLAVFPSFYEPFGIVATEAMSMGKPVIVGASGINGFREQVINDGPDQCGYHVNPQDPADIARHISLLLSDPEKMNRFGMAGRRRVLSMFTWDRAADETAGIYRRTVADFSGVNAV